MSATVVREYWAIENRLYWVLDVTFADDQSRLRKATAPATWPPSATTASSSAAPWDGWYCLRDGHEAPAESE